VTIAKNKMVKQFNCNESGAMKEYIGCKIDQSNGAMKLSQPLLLQSFVDKFDFPGGNYPETPAEPNTVLKQARKKTVWY
jgi:hypothetical protein